MYLTQTIHKALREKPRETALICADETLSWGQLGERVQRLAAALQGLGVKPGERVAMLALNSNRFVEYLYAVWWAGAVINPVNIRWTAHEVAFSLDDCDTRVLIVDDAFAPLVPRLRELSKSLQTVVFCGSTPGKQPAGALRYEDLLADAVPVEDALRRSSDLAAIMYTGGTTGRPKGVMLSHQNMRINALASLTMRPLPPTGAQQHMGMVVTPIFHVAGCGLCLILGKRLNPSVIVPFFDELAILQAIEKYRVNELFLVPTMIKRVIDHPRFAEFDLSSLRLLGYGASPIDSTLLTQAMERLPPGTEFSQAYGMTELSPTIVIMGDAEHRPGPQRERLLRAAGKPLPIAEVRVVDGQDKELPPGQVGEICARGPMTMLGYWNRPEESAAALKGGWMHTGDMGYFDEDGYLFVVDRLKDMIVSGGENIYSAEVENAIAQLPQIAMCAVIGVPDEQWGERVHAAVVLHEGQSLSAEAIIAHCREQIAAYKCPRSVEFRSELPLSAAGKLQKFQLRAPYWKDKSRSIN